MAVEIIVLDEFRDWYEGLTQAEQESIGAVVGMLEELGIALGFPYSSGISGSRFPEMRELRIQHTVPGSLCLRSNRQAVLLVGGSKAGKDRWYERAVKRADNLFEKYIAQRPGTRS